MLYKSRGNRRRRNLHRGRRGGTSGRVWVTVTGAVGRAIVAGCFVDSEVSYMDSGVCSILIGVMSTGDPLNVRAWVNE